MELFKRQRGKSLKELILEAQKERDCIRNKRDIYKDKYLQLENNIKRFLDVDLLSISSHHLFYSDHMLTKEELKKYIILHLDDIVKNIEIRDNNLDVTHWNACRYEYCMPIMVKGVDESEKTKK